MNVVIIEDEKTAAKNLQYLLSEVDASIHIDKVIDTVSGAVDYFSEGNYYSRHNILTDSHKKVVVLALSI